MLVKKIIALLMVALLLSCSTNGPKEKDAPLWNKMEKSSIKLESTIINLPNDYVVFKLNIDSLERNLNIKESTGNTKIQIPNPNGELKDFTFEKSSVMSEKLAKKFPDLHSFKGAEVESPSTTVRFEYTPSGFTAMYTTDKGQVFVQPYNKEDVHHYICYYKNEIDVDKKPFEQTQKRN